MQRRFFLQSVGLGGAAAFAATSQAGATAAPPPMKITRVRFYHNPNAPANFNQSFNIVTVETDQGVTGIGEGGSRDTISQCAAMIIGENPLRIEHLWQMMFRGYFYPAGREKLDALGAIDLALWDVKGKALGVPVYELLGGLSHDHLECYSTGFPNQGSLKETARACLEAGFRAFRYATADPGAGQPFNSRTRAAWRSAKGWEKTAIGRWITTPASTSRMPCGSAL
jgi:L-alanine-DL-glutamate epimerase-like enolase superfamily enzyme